MKNTKEFTGATQTKSGIKTKNVVYNDCAELYLGMVKDNWSSIPGHEWTTCSWRKNGKCVNRLRPELDLI